MENIEFESRLIITKQNYLDIIQDINSLVNKEKALSIKKIRQENIYLDDQEHTVEKNDWAFRIRNIYLENETKQELTLKIKRDNGDLEINESLDSHPEIDKYLPNQFNEYKEVARLITLRIEIEFIDHIFVIDENKYHGIVDYNIEVESKTHSKESAAAHLMRYCALYHIDTSIKGNNISKSKRAILASKKFN